MIFSEILVGKNIFLKTLGPDDASERYVDWLCDPEVNQFLETRTATIEDLRKYIVEKIESKTALFFGIFFADNSLHIGNVKLEPIDWENKSATMGILIGDKGYWGRGIGTEAVELVVKCAFEKLGLSEVELGVISSHEKAIKMYKKCGFEVQRVEKNVINHSGQLFDQVVMRKKK